MSYKFDTTKMIEIVEPSLIEGKISEPINLETEFNEIVKLGEKMINLCVEKNGLGLSAPQVGVFKRMFVWMNGPNQFQIVVNPTWIASEKKKTNLIEHCLTYPGKNYYTQRFKRILVKFDVFNPTKNKFEVIKKNLENERAYIFQHEADHLDGNTIATKGIDISKVKD